MLHAAPSEAHVLAVDDSLIDRKVIERLLKTTSCRVTAVDSGMRALEILGLDADQRNSAVDDLKVDLIITDYCMPGMTGYDLLKRIKNSSTFKETPVVIMSSENVVTRIHRCLEEGAEDFILKPVTLSDVKRLRDYMSKEERSNGQETRINKRKERDGPDLPTQPIRSPPSDSTMFSSESRSPPSISSSSTPTPCSPSGPLDSPTSPSSPSEPLDCPAATQSGPLECSDRMEKMSGSDEDTVGSTSLSNGGD